MIFIKLVIAVLAIILLMIEYFNEKRSSDNERASFGLKLFIGILIVALTSVEEIYNFFERKNSERLTTLSGLLKAPDVKPDNDSIITILIGSDTFQYLKKDLINGETLRPIDIQGIMPYTVFMKDGQLMLNCKVYDNDGNVVGHVSNNYWNLSTSNWYKYNFDKSGFEVFDKKDFPTLSVSFKDKNTLVINGIFHSRGYGYAFANSQGYETLQYANGFKTVIERIEGKPFEAIVEEKANLIPIIFDYTGPKEEYLGKRADTP